MATRAVLDPAVIDTLRRLSVPGEPDVLTEVLKLFLEEAPTRIETLRNAWTDRNIQEGQRMAHSLKGSAGNIGASALFDVCKQLDQVGRAGGPVDASGLVAALDDEYGKVKVEIHRITGA